MPTCPLHWTMPTCPLRRAMPTRPLRWATSRSCGLGALPLPQKLAYLLSEHASAGMEATHHVLDELGHEIRCWSPTARRKSRPAPCCSKANPAVAVPPSAHEPHVRLACWSSSSLLPAPRPLPPVAVPCRLLDTCASLMCGVLCSLRFPASQAADGLAARGPRAGAAPLLELLEHVARPPRLAQGARPAVVGGGREDEGGVAPR